jgi:hypothetical protein
MMQHHIAVAARRRPVIVAVDADAKPAHLRDLDVVLA